MSKRIFRLKKEGAQIYAGALYEQEYSGPKQKYLLINGNEVRKFPAIPGINRTVAHWESIEDNPEYYEEVFPMVPAYGTKEELKKFRKGCK